MIVMAISKEYLPLSFGVVGYYPPGSEIGRNPQFCEDTREKTMKFVIYGREKCSFCKQAVELAKQLQGHGYGEYQYIDIVAAGIDKQKLSDMVGKPVETIPQVFWTMFQSVVTQNLLLSRRQFDQKGRLAAFFRFLDIREQEWS